MRKRHRAGWMIFGLVVVICGCLAVPMVAQEGEKAKDNPLVHATFVGNGKEANLQYALVINRDPWQDERSYIIIVSEKDPASGDNPEFDAMFGRLGHSLTFDITESGDLFGTQVCHQGMEKKSISSIGNTEVKDFKIANGRLSVRFVMPEEHEFFGDTWIYDVKIDAPLPK